MGTSRSTQWARDNREKIRAKDLERKGTLDGKLISLITQSRYRSKQSNRDHLINTEYLRGIYKSQDGKCALSGIEMTLRGARGSTEYWTSISLDRIDSKLGYIHGNVQLVCTAVNYMKKDMSDVDFITFCTKVSEKFK